MPDITYRGNPNKKKQISKETKLKYVKLVLSQEITKTQAAIEIYGNVNGIKLKTKRNQIQQWVNKYLAQKEDGIRNFRNKEGKKSKKRAKRELSPFTLTKHKARTIGPGFLISEPISKEEKIFSENFRIINTEDKRYIVNKIYSNHDREWSISNILQALEFPRSTYYQRSIKKGLKKKISI